MSLKKALMFPIFVSLLALSSASPALASTSTDELKAEILKLAESYQGQGDPDQSKQKTLDVLVDQLVAQNPMPPVAERINLLAGAWKQVWGPYEYRKNDGSVDPTLGFTEIYQVVFADGYYYNVAPFYPDQDRSREQIGLLRGEFNLDQSNPNALKVKFTDYPGVKPRPTKPELWELPALAESGKLENVFTIVPSWAVKLFFGGGTLEEVYTDRELRILYGTSASANARRSLYVMSRVK